MATVRDVARAAGTSVSAAAEVLNGSGKHNIRVGQDTRVRILDAARDLQYQPNAIARALTSRRTNIVGLYSGYHYLDPRNAFLAEIVGGLQDGCAVHRKDLLLHSIFRGGSVDDIYSELLDGRIDGLIMTAPPEDPLVERLAASQLPVIVVADAVPALPSVVVDDRQAAILTFDYLAERGHRRFEYLSADTHLFSAERRRGAYFSVASEQNIDLTEWRGTGDDFLGDWLKQPIQRRSTAVICWNDLAAYDLLAHCDRRGIKVPEDMAITGFDGNPNPTAFRWQLTTVNAPWAEVAYTALTHLVARIEGRENEVPRETVLPVTFIPGHSA